jgi:hypothetical protein
VFYLSCVAVVSAEGGKQVENEHPRQHRPQCGAISDSGRRGWLRSGSQTVRRSAGPYSSNTPSRNRSLWATEPVVQPGRSGDLRVAGEAALGVPGAGGRPDPALMARRQTVT